MAAGFAEGSLLGERYRLERVLGTGGMATVWLARDERLRRAVAVKLLADTLASDESYRRRFDREARVAAGLSHPNLVKVYDFAGEDERPYLVMEHVEGGTLAERAAAGRAGELDPGGLAGGLLGALEHIHAAGIVHRDVKPANVLFTSDDTAKLTDFGIARPEDATELTQTGLVLGTRSYIAPEVLRGERATPAADLYACGVLLEEAFGEELPPELAALSGRLRAENPADRPASAAEAMALLGAGGSAGAGAATAPTQPLPPDPTGATVPIGAAAARSGFDRRLLAGIALLVALILGAIVLLSGGDEAAAPRESDRGAAESGERGREEAIVDDPEPPTPDAEPTNEKAEEKGKEQEKREKEREKEAKEREKKREKEAKERGKEREG